MKFKHDTDKSICTVLHFYILWECANNVCDNKIRYVYRTYRKNVTLLACKIIHVRKVMIPYYSVESTYII